MGGRQLPLDPLAALLRLSTRRSALAAAISVATLACLPGAAGANPQTKVKDPVPLLELVASGGSGRLYTLNQAEANRAVAAHGYRLEPVRTGYMRQASFKGSQPLFRLRSNERPAYLVTASVAERDSLVASGRFTYEGVLGHAARQPDAGLTTLWRYSNGSEWRLVLDSGRAALERQGYRADGRLGHVPARWIRAGALYFGAWNSERRSVIEATERVYGRSGDWWGGVRDFSGQDPEVPVNRWEWPDDDFSDLKPAIGYYDDSRRETLEAQISQATAAGLSYFSFYWYWAAAAGREHIAAAHHAFLRARNRNAIDFTIGVCAHRHLPIPREHFDRAADLLARTYVSQPNFLRANDGRPVLQLCDSGGLGAGSTEDVRAFVDAVRGAVRSRLGEEILVLSEWELGLGAAAGSQGQYCGARVSRPAGSYRDYVDTHRSFLRQDRLSGVLIRCAMSNFDERPRYPIAISDPSPEEVRYYTGQTPELFARALRIAREEVGRSTRAPVVDNLVQLYAWNEWREGGYIEPNVRDGCLYLDLVRRELGLAGRGCGRTPRLVLRRAKRQPALRRKAVRVRARCSVDCTLRARARLRPRKLGRTPRRTRFARPGRAVRLRLAIRPRQRKRIRRRLRAGRRARAVVRVRAADPAGNARTRKVRVRITRGARR